MNEGTRQKGRAIRKKSWRLPRPLRQLGHEPLGLNVLPLPFLAGFIWAFPSHVLIFFKPDCAGNPPRLYPPCPTNTNIYLRPGEGVVTKTSPNGGGVVGQRGQGRWTPVWSHTILNLSHFGAIWSLFGAILYWRFCAIFSHFVVIVQQNYKKLSLKYVNTKK